jgi:hypothetical protein
MSQPAGQTVVPVIQPRQRTTDGWATYPEGVDSFNPFQCDAEAVRQRLLDQERLIFSNSDVSIDITDASGTVVRTLVQEVMY